MPGVGTRIYASDYNTIRNKVRKVLGPEPVDPLAVGPSEIGSPNGDPTYGYGQVLNATEEVDSTKIITYTQWANLRLDLLSARKKQIGPSVPPSIDYGLPSLVDGNNAPVKVSENIRLKFLEMANTIDTERLSRLPATQATTDNIAVASQNPGWSASKTHNVYAEFASYSAARYYFNAGGELWFYAQFTGGQSLSAGTKDYDWANFVPTSSQPVKLSWDTTRCESNALGQTIANIGIYELPVLPTPRIQIYSKSSTANTAYTNDSYAIFAAWGDSTRKVLDIQIRFTDGAAKENPNWPGQGLSTDEAITATMVSVVQSFRPSSLTGVNLPPPSTSNGNYIS